MTKLETYKYIETKIYCPISYMLIQSTFFSLYSIFISTTYTSSKLFDTDENNEKVSDF